MQLSTNGFIYECKDGKPGHIYKGNHLFAVIYSSESATQAITEFLNNAHQEQQPIDRDNYLIRNNNID